MSRDSHENTLAWLMDKSIRLPGGLRIGLDGLIGLIPGLGDATTSVISSWFLYDGYRKGLPSSVLLRMAFNILLDTAFGSIPIIGDIFDLFFRANIRNSQLIERFQNSPENTRRSSVTFIVIASLIFITILWGLILIVTTIAKLLFDRLFVN